MMKLLVAAVVLGLVFGEAAAHQLKMGSCKKMTPMANFDPKKLVGDWYVIKKMATDSSCMLARFGIESDSVLTVQELRTPSLTKMIPLEITVTNVGKLTMDPTQKASMRLKWDGNFLKDIVTTSYAILDTDYTTYALDMECQSFTIFHRLSATIYGRNATIPSETMKMLETKLQQLNVDLTRMSAIDQKNCVPLESNDYNIKIDEKGLSLLGLLQNDEIQKLENLDQVKEYAENNVQNKTGNKP
ncbi:apolipoprotein D-like [Macrobrachium rosenbergii]|uniref:apolipoprotein D-like n=1 Tax=Macrobrachium rosenbergii TaxID=79674 RepID=UPI0034D64B51